MDWIKKTFFILFINLSFTAILFGQANEELTTKNDFWTGVSFKYKLNKKIAFNLDNQVRITDNLNEIRSTFFEFGVKYKFNKYFSARAQHRYIIRSKERHVNRFTLDATGRWKLKPVKLELSYRFRIQHGAVTFTKEPSSFIRNRFQARYSLFKKMKVFARYESFYQFNDKNRFRQNLFAAGLYLKVNKQLDLSIFYRFDQKINTKNPERRNIIAVLVTYEL
ncbi:MAG: DUF2490 domain-containing protein [Crocinitomicaceae bacterium]|nr:DUF2490 domain-containing protein [Crocinitomicaceae bacterium]